MNYVGDYLHGATVYMLWNTTAADGASITRATDGSIRIYRNGSDTQRSSSNGITDTEDFDSLTGVHLLQINTADNTDSGFYAPGYEYHVVLQGAVIDTKTVNAAIGAFSIERASMPLTPRTPFASADPVMFSTAQPDITGATATGITDVVTGGSSGSLVTGIAVRALTDTKLGTVLHIYHLAGATRRNIGSLVVPPERRPNGQNGPWEGVWNNPGVALLSGDKLQIAPVSGDTVYVASALGGDL